MRNNQNKPLTPDQVTDAKCLCEVIRGIPDRKRPIFEIAMLAYMNGMEAGVAYAKDVAKVSKPARM